MINPQYIYISFIISILFFILKQLQYRKNPIKEQNKILIKDSTLICFITIACLHLKDYYLKSQELETKIFTGEPSF